MGFRYQLATPDGEIFDEAEYAYAPQAGDVIYLSSNRRARVVSVVPEERIGEFVDGTNKTEYGRPEHRSCNRATAVRRVQQRYSRRW